MILLLLLLGIRAGAMDWYSVTVQGALIPFMFVVGFKLIKKQPLHDEAARPKRRPSKLDD